MLLAHEANTEVSTGTDTHVGGASGGPVPVTVNGSDLPFIQVYKPTWAGSGNTLLLSHSMALAILSLASPHPLPGP